jgi:beta-galactosidase
MQLGVCYYPEQWPSSKWRQDAQRMVELGIRVVRIGEFAWSRIEPAPERFDWSWLDEAIAVLDDAGLKLVLGTPTAAPPRWLIAQHPDILPCDAHGQPKSFGSRRHYSFSSEPFFEASRRIVAALGGRYGARESLVAWQLDNEYGCHDTVLSYDPAALRAFRAWLARRYNDVRTLNDAWGNVFWSAEYASFDEIGFPVGMPAQINPIHALDFRRFASDEVRRFNRMQVDILRELSPGRPVLTNFMSQFTEFDHHALAADLDLATWDSYPLGALERQASIGDADRKRWMRTGHPDLAAFTHDLVRNLGRGRFWVMEQQAGPVNWAFNNPVPAAGIVRAWTWEAFAHGAEVVSYFRWRQLPYAAEQMHSGLLAPDDRLDSGGLEAGRVAQELARVPEVPPSASRVALVFDYETKWMTDLQRHGAGFDYLGLCFRWYGALRRLGLDVDIVGPESSLDGRALVVVPTLSVVEARFVARLEACGAHAVFGPRCGSKTRNFAIPPGLPPGELAQLLPMRTLRVDTTPPDHVEDVIDASGSRLGQSRHWRDIIEPLGDTQVVFRFADAAPALLQHGRFRAIAGDVDDVLLAAWLRTAVEAAGIAVCPVADGLRLRSRGPLRFAINYGPGRASVPAPPGTRFLVGGPVLDPCDVAVWQ